MPVPADHVESVIESLRRATAANLQTPSRQGNIICLDAEQGDDVLVAADLHGNRLNFDKLLRAADLGQAPRRHVIMQEVCHGGPQYPAGGCMSHLLLEDIAGLKCEYPERFHFIMSNHELAELTDFPILKASRMLNLSFRNGLQEMYGPAAESVRAEYLKFLRSCPLAVRIEPSTFICHSAPEYTDREGFDVSVFQRHLEESDFQPDTPLFKLVWGRDFREENARAFAASVEANVLIHGHEPCPNGYSVPNSRQVIIDSHANKACYIMLPVGKRLSQEDVVKRIKKLT